MLRNCKKRKTNLAITCVDCNEAYSLISESWIRECQDMFGAAENITNFFSDNIKSGRLGLAAKVEVLSDVGWRMGIFQWGSFSPYIFALCMIHMCMIQCQKRPRGVMNGKTNILGKPSRKTSSYLGNMKTNWFLSQGCSFISKCINMEFGFKKCGILILKR